jgi:hypothetical protein
MTNLRGLAVASLSLIILLPVNASPAGGHETLSGKIIRIEGKHHLVVAETRTAGTWYVGDTDKYRIGERISGTGSLKAGVFFPSEIHPIGMERRPPAPATSNMLASCGGYRWSIKIAADPGASQILSGPTPTTIANLVSLKHPPTVAIRNAPVETTTWQVVNARLSLLYQEHDRDYHLVLDDRTGHHLIAEAPLPACTRTSALLPEMTRVRSAINMRFGGVRGTMRPNMPVSVRGVGFFDEYSGTAGQARNAIELHPITEICFGENCAL